MGWDKGKPTKFSAPMLQWSCSSIADFHCGDNYCHKRKCDDAPTSPSGNKLNHVTSNKKPKKQRSGKHPSNLILRPFGGPHKPTHADSGGPSTQRKGSMVTSLVHASHLPKILKKNPINSKNRLLLFSLKSQISRCVKFEWLFC